jgi:hypothetical protein
MACITSRVGLLLVVVLAAGCATTKTGSGSALSGTNPVKFGWNSRGNISGSMTATFANGGTFTGRFSQITSSLTDELGSQGPIWHQEGLYDVGPGLDGMAGGARGECQLPDGLSVNAQFPAD